MRGEIYNEPYTELRESRDAIAIDHMPHQLSEIDLALEEYGYMSHQSFYNFAASMIQQTDMYTYDIPQDDLDAAQLLPQWNTIQLIYTDLRWNGGSILNSLYTALGDCINQNYEVQKCLYQQSVIQQVFGDYPYLDQGEVPYGNTESNEFYNGDSDPYDQNETGFYGSRPLDFTS